MSTDTVFKGKTCPRCKNNHANDGVLCSFCANESQRRLDKVQPIPVNYWVECLIQREGDTVVALGGIQYRFRRNEADHSVCEIINPGHYKQFTERMGSFYRAYAPDTDYPEIRQAAEKAEAERLEAEKAEAERLEAERLEAERLEAEKAEAEKNGKQTSSGGQQPEADNNAQQESGGWKEPSLLPEADNRSHKAGKAQAKK